MTISWWDEGGGNHPAPTCRAATTMATLRRPPWLTRPFRAMQLVMLIATVISSTVLTCLPPGNYFGPCGPAVATGPQSRGPPQRFLPISVARRERNSAAPAASCGLSRFNGGQYQAATGARPTHPSGATLRQLSSRWARSWMPPLFFRSKQPLLRKLSTAYVDFLLMILIATTFLSLEAATTQKAFFSHFF